MTSSDGGLSEVLRELSDTAEANGKNGRVAVGDLIDALDARGYGAALAVLPLIEISPLGAVPGFPTALALVLALITVRLLLGHEHLWAPGWVRRRTLKADRVETALDWLQPLAARIDKRLHERLETLAGPAARRVACIVILVLLLSVPPLEVIPMATTAPMLAIAVFGFGMLFRDGLIMLFGFVGAAAALGVGLWSAFGA